MDGKFFLWFPSGFRFRHIHTIYYYILNSCCVSLFAGRHLVKYDCQFFQKTITVLSIAELFFHVLVHICNAFKFRVWDFTVKLVRRLAFQVSCQKPPLGPVMSVLVCLRDQVPDIFRRTLFKSHGPPADGKCCCGMYGDPIVTHILDLSDLGGKCRGYLSQTDAVFIRLGLCKLGDLRIGKFRQFPVYLFVPIHGLVFNILQVFHRNRLIFLPGTFIYLLKC